MVEEVVYFESVIAKEAVLSHVPMNRIGVAQKVDGIVSFNAKEHFETFGGNAFVEETLPCLYNGFVGCVGSLAKVAQGGAEVVDAYASLFKLAEDAVLLECAEIGADVYAQLIERAEHLFAVEVYDDAAKVEKQEGSVGTGWVDRHS